MSAAQPNCGLSSHVSVAACDPTEPWLALTAIITFEAEGTGTRYAARVLHKKAEDSRKHEEMGFQEGWGTTIDQLATFVEGLA